MPKRTKKVFINPGYENPYFRGHTWPIAFDMDSVLNEGTWLRHYVAEHFGTTMAAVKGHDRNGGHEVFHFKIPGVDDEMRRVIDLGIKKESPSALPTPHLREVMEYVHLVTERPILVITFRNRDNADVTRRWLSENLHVPYMCVICDGMNKHHMLRMVEAQIFVDDRHKTIKNLWRKNVIPYPVVYKRPWNQGRARKLPVCEINDLRDIIPLLNIQLGRNPMDWPAGLPHPDKRGDLCLVR